MSFTFSPTLSTASVVAWRARSTASSTASDSLRPISEVDSNGVFTHFVYDSNNPESDAPIALIRAGVFYRVVKDHLGSVTLVVNTQTGNVAQTIDYDAYGRLLLAAMAGGAVGGALAPIVTAELVATGGMLSLLNAGLLANAATNVVGSLVTSAVDPKQRFFSANTAYNAIGSGVFAAGGYLGADKFGRALWGSQFFAESFGGGVTSASIGIFGALSQETLMDRLSREENQCRVGGGN